MKTTVKSLFPSLRGINPNTVTEEETGKEERTVSPVFLSRTSAFPGDREVKANL